MKEPLVLENGQAYTCRISCLKNLNLENFDVSLRSRHSVEPKDKDKSKFKERLKKIFNTIADDLINLYQKDYKTSITAFVFDSELTLMIHKGYPFFYTLYEGVKEEQEFIFNLDECVDQKSINNRIDIMNTAEFKRVENSYMYSKSHSDITKMKQFYQHLNYVDRLFFKESTLVNHHKYILSIYSIKEGKYYKFGTIKSLLDIGDYGPRVEVYIGSIKLKVSADSISIKSKVKNTKKIVIKNKITYSKIEDAFTQLYNEVYETHFEEAKEIVLVHEMITI